MCITHMNSQTEPENDVHHRDACGKTTRRYEHKIGQILTTRCCGINTRRYQAQSLLLWSLRPPSSPSSSDLLLRLSALRFNSHNLSSSLLNPEDPPFPFSSSIASPNLRSAQPPRIASPPVTTIAASPEVLPPTTKLRHRRKLFCLHRKLRRHHHFFSASCFFSIAPSSLIDSSTRPVNSAVFCCSRHLQASPEIAEFAGNLIRDRVSISDPIGTPDPNPDPRRDPARIRFLLLHLQHDTCLTQTRLILVQLD